MKYEKAPEIEKEARRIIEKLDLKHIDKENISCIRSYGSKSNAIARCHGLGKAMQLGLDRKAFYTLEFISEKFDKQDEKDKIKTIIHELLHIPNNFGGGFKHHNYVNKKRVNKMYKKLKDSDNMDSGDSKINEINKKGKKEKSWKEKLNFYYET
ncbi:MAG: putative metallopeptidase [Nanoarchaeota archaeon]